MQNVSAHLSRMHLWAMTLAASLVLVGCEVLPFLTKEYVISSEELTARLTKRFPIEQNMADLLKVTLTRPRVSVTEPEVIAGAPQTTAPAVNGGRRLAVSVDMEVKLPLTQKSLFGQMTLTGAPRYNTTSRSIFLDDAKLERVRVDNMPDAIAGALSKAASQFAREYFQDKPIYSFDEKDMKKLGQTIVPQRIDLRRDQLVFVLK
jgi:Protein of unknown function (DUF1439)